MVGHCFSENRLAVYQAFQGTIKESMSRGSRSLWTTSTGGNDSIKYESKRFKVCDARLIYYVEDGANTAHVDLDNPLGEFSNYELALYKGFYQ